MEFHGKFLISLLERYGEVLVGFGSTTVRLLIEGGLGGLLERVIMG
jgi:hypothetical protein